jgi:photosystem II stability/assembly factor-like uncharacterized protein
MLRATVGAGALLGLLLSLWYLQQMNVAPPVVSRSDASGRADHAWDAPALVPTRAVLPECTDGDRVLAGSHPLAFVDPLHGWMQGRVCSDGTWRNIVAATQDGGQTWRAVSSPAATGVLRFVSPSDGWLIGESTLSTHDGGVTWIEDPVLKGVVVLEAVGDSIWAVQERCQATYECDHELVVSSDRGATWKPMVAQPPLHGGRVLPPMPGYRLQVTRIGLEDAWILSGGNSFPASVFVTHDGGATWQHVSVPSCTEWSYILATIHSDRLWLLCSGLPSAGGQSKELYESLDEGTEWQLITGSATLTEPGHHNLPGRGYTSSFVAISERRAFMGLSRGGLVTTQDGGQIWRTVPLQDIGDGIVQVVFVDQQHGWVATRTAIWRTTDGGDTWERIGI